MSEASTGCIHRRREALAGRQGAARHVPQRPPGRPAGARAEGGAGGSAVARPEGDRRRDRRLRDSRGGAGDERRARRAAAGGSARHGRRCDGQPLLLIGAAGGVDGGGPHPAGRGRRDDRGRHREHEHDPDGREQDLVQRAHLRQRRGHRHRLRHGDHRREGGAAVEASRARRRTGSRWRAIEKPLPPRRAASSGTRSRPTRSTKKCPTSRPRRSSTSPARWPPTRARAPTLPWRCWPSCGRPSPRKAA